MKTIWKYELDITDTQYIDMPRGTKILAVQIQGGVPCIWALVLSEESVMPVKIVMIGTGHPADEINVMEYIGTFQAMSGTLVFHVFAEVPK